MSDNEIERSVDKYLSLNKYYVDERGAHIELSDQLDDDEFMKLVRVCPASLYRVRDDGTKSFDYSGCLECGTCRILSMGTCLDKWVNPRSTKGIEYLYG